MNLFEARVDEVIRRRVDEAFAPYREALEALSSIYSAQQRATPPTTARRPKSPRRAKVSVKTKAVRQPSRSVGPKPARKRQASSASMKAKVVTAVPPIIRRKQALATSTSVTAPEAQAFSKMLEEARQLSSSN